MQTFEYENIYTREFLLEMKKVKNLESIVEKCTFLIDNFGNHEVLLNRFKYDYAAFGVCCVVGISGYSNQRMLGKKIAETFPNAYSENQTINTAYPVGGILEFTQQDYRIRWSNKRRLDYTIHVRDFCEKLIEEKSKQEESLFNLLRIQINNV